MCVVAVFVYIVAKCRQAQLNINLSIIETTTRWFDEIKKVFFPTFISSKKGKSKKTKTKNRGKYYLNFASFFMLCCFSQDPWLLS